MRVSRRNQQLLFTFALVIVIGLAIGYSLERGLGKLGEKGDVLALAESLAQCTSREQYLAVVQKHYPPESRFWQSPMMKAADGVTTPPAALERLPDQRFKVTVVVTQPQDLLLPGRYVYLPAALVDDKGRGHRIVDIRVNSRQKDLVFEYYFAAPSETASRGAAESFRFFLGQHQWLLKPAKGP